MGRWYALHLALLLVEPLEPCLMMALRMACKVDELSGEAQLPVMMLEALVLSSQNLVALRSL